MNHAHIYATQLGPALIEADDDSVLIITLKPRQMPCADSPNAITNACANELLQYFSGHRRTFSVPCSPLGSAFEQEVWEAARMIPYGQTRTCSDIANAIGRPQAHRQVGRAAAACPCIPLIGAHRILSMDDAMSVHLRKLEQDQ